VPLRGGPGGGPGGASHGKRPAPVTKASLTAFRSCSEALAGLRKATEASITQYGLPYGGISGLPGGMLKSYAAGEGVAAAAGPAAAGAATAPLAAAPASPAYSGTNDYQAGVEEPDLVKTDGRRIVTVAGDTLEVIDAASRRVTGLLNLSSAGVQAEPVNLLLSGDRVLLIGEYARIAGDAAAEVASYGPRFFLVSIAGKPRILASYSIEGDLIDARQVGSVVRVVTGFQPDIVFPDLPSGASAAQRVAAYRAVTGRAALEAWLPSYVSSAASGGTSPGSGGTVSGRVPCTAVSRPASYTGTSLVTVLTFDMSGDAFGTGDPVSVVADGNTVYGTTSSLYVASDGIAGSPGSVEPAIALPAERQQTQIYRFDIAAPGAPRFAASGSVPGYLVDQYAMSEWNGYLRVATTTGTSWALADGKPAGARTSSSAVYVLTTAGPVMRIVGQVTGLGSTERIYAVRFIGPVGYVVTFRQTDPLYTVNLSDPRRPRVVGALGLTGYSAYLHPVSAARLIGIGQQADVMGHVLGTQVSLFDVSDPAAPARLATYALASSMSTAETDPHAFLYWPADQLVVVPIQAWGGPVAGGSTGPAESAGSLAPAGDSGALVLRVTDAAITRAGFITQPQSVPSGSSGGYGWPIERSLVIGQTLWTVSVGGVLAIDLTTLRQQAWLPFAASVNPYPERTVAPASAP
jgi:hypothetical protein